MQIIDLSLPIDDTLKETHFATIDRISHGQGVEHLNWVIMSKQPGGEERFKKGERLIKPEDVPNKELLSLEEFNDRRLLADKPYCGIACPAVVKN